VSRVLYWLPLAHHRRDQLERCLLVPLGGGRRLALCARCLGLYPALALALLLQGWLRLGPAGTADWVLVLSGVFPALFDWGLSWLGRRRGSNALRLATGVMLGLSLGRGFWLYFRDPRCEVFWVQLGLLVFGALAFELVRRLRI
jgi:uncharacterized membrane protein